MELSGVSPKLKGENKDSSPYPPFNVVPLFELPVEKNEHPYIEWRGGGVDSFFSEVTLFEYNVSTVLSPIVGNL